MKDKIPEEVAKKKPFYVEKIVSGGQTGVDRAALDVALELGIPCGGWCPKGRIAEDGPIDAHYPLQETASPRYPVRTERNVRDSDGTLILTWGRPSGGTALTIKLAQKQQKPFCVVDLFEGGDPNTVVEWAKMNRIRVLNVAGPPESKAPGIHNRAFKFLQSLFSG
jgi:hypothetical protein